MNTSEIQAAVKDIDTAKDRLEKLKDSRSKLNCSGHNAEIRISVGDQYFPVTYLDRSYSSKIIRGREMIALGAIKVMDELIADAENRLAERIKKLRELVR